MYEHAYLLSEVGHQSAKRLPGISAKTQAGPTRSGKYQSGSDSSTNMTKASLFSRLSMRSEAQLPAQAWQTMARPELF